MVEAGAMNLMSNFKVRVNRENAWLVTNLQSGLTRNFLCKADAEKYLDLQENVRPTTKGDNLQAETKKAECSLTTKTDRGLSCQQRVHGDQPISPKHELPRAHPVECPIL